MDAPVSTATPPTRLPTAGGPVECDVPVLGSGAGGLSAAITARKHGPEVIVAETAAVLGRSDGAVKQLQLRGVRNLAKLMPEGVR